MLICVLVPIILIIISIACRISFNKGKGKPRKLSEIKDGSVWHVVYTGGYHFLLTPCDKEVDPTKHHEEYYVREKNLILSRDIVVGKTYRFHKNPGVWGETFITAELVSSKSEK